MLQDEPHPFVTAMADFLIECGRRSVRPSIVNSMMSSTNAKFEADQKIMFDLVNQSESVADTINNTC